MKYSKDKRVVFQEGDHSYSLKDKKLLSVTTFIHQFKNEFDSDFFSKKIAKRDKKTQAEVLAEWKAKADKSCDIGTAVHKIFEDYANGNYSVQNDELTIDFFDIQPEYFTEFYHKAKVSVDFIKKFFVTNRLTPVYTEHIVYNKHLAGQIDMICKDQEGRHYIIDFKTNEKIEEYSYNKKMKGVFLDYNDSNYFHYCLQLSIYKKMFKEHDIHKMYLIHIKQDGYNVLECHDMLETIELKELQ